LQIGEIKLLVDNGSIDVREYDRQEEQLLKEARKNY
jgi:hypothetical protein